MKRETLACIEVSFVNILWGLSFIASKTALAGGFCTFTLAFVRFLVASVLLLPVMWKRQGTLRLPKGSFPLMLLSAILGITLYFLLEYRGLARTGASTASLIIASVPAFTLLYGCIFRRQKYPWISYVGVAASLLGVFLIVKSGTEGSTDTLAGDLYIVGAALCWVGYVEVSNVMLRKYNGLAVTTWQSILGALTLLPLMLTEHQDWSIIPLNSWLMAMYLAVFCSFLAYILYVDTIKHLKPFRTALFINLNPVAGVLGGMIFLGEKITLLQLLGGVIVLVSIFLVNRTSTTTET